jgi:hypothetical protein
MGWSVLCGVVEQHYDQRLLDLGRHRFWRERGRANDDYVMLTEEPTTFRSAFLATRDPWRLMLVDPADAGSLGLVGMMGSAWVSLSGGPSAPKIDGDVTGRVTVGDLCVNALVVPNWLTLVIGRPLTASFEVPPGRLFAAAEERETEQAGCLLSLGVERYAVRYNEELEIITSWRTYIDGTEAHWARLSFVHPMG